MPGDNDLPASDGLPAYEASIVTLAKLELLRQYLGGFCVASKPGGAWYGLDLFAGSGLNIAPSGREVSGSTLSLLEATGTGAADNPASGVVAIESNAERCRALQARTLRFGARSHVLEGSYEDRLDDALRLVPRKSVSFAVIDPEGFDVGWSTIEKLAGHRVHPRNWKMEQLVLFPSSSICRLQEEKHHHHLDRVFGNESWREIYSRRFTKALVAQTDLFGGETINEIRAAQTMTAEEAAMAWADLYAGRFKSELGYAFAQAIPMGNELGRLKYHLIFASDSTAGDKIMKWVGSKIPADPSALDPDKRLLPLF